jgi:hypothetical protein
LILDNNLVFIFSNWYSRIIFQGIILDTSATGVFIIGISQVIIFQKLDPIIIIDKLIIRKHRIWFSKKQTISISIIQVDTLFGNI